MSIMKITKSKLKQIIKEELAYALKEADNSEAVTAAIEKYTSEPGASSWRRQGGDFDAMAAGDDLDGIRDQYYPGWTNEDFQDVIDGVEGVEDEDPRSSLGGMIDVDYEDPITARRGNLEEDQLEE
jgi:hypothetical protein